VPDQTFLILKKSVAIISGSLTRRGSCPDGAIRAERLGGDHTLSWPTPCRAVAEKTRACRTEFLCGCPIPDTNDAEIYGRKSQWLSRREHGRKGLSANDKVVPDWSAGQTRGYNLLRMDFDWGRAAGWMHSGRRMRHKSLTPLMADIRAKIGDAPVYLTYDNRQPWGSAFRPPVTGTVEVGGLTTMPRG